MYFCFSNGEIPEAISWVMVAYPVLQVRLVSSAGPPWTKNPNLQKLAHPESVIIAAQSSPCSTER